MWATVMTVAKNAVEENIKFNEYCDTLSEEDAKAVRKSRSERLALESQRRHEIEVAKAGKPDSGAGYGFLGFILGASLFGD